MAGGGVHDGRGIGGGAIVGGGLDSHSLLSGLHHHHAAQQQCLCQQRPESSSSSGAPAETPPGSDSGAELIATASPPVLHFGPGATVVEEKETPSHAAPVDDGRNDACDVDGVAAAGRRVPARHGSGGGDEEAIELRDLLVPNAWNSAAAASSAPLPPIHGRARRGGSSSPRDLREDAAGAEASSSKSQARRSGDVEILDEEDEKSDYESESDDGEESAAQTRLRRQRGSNGRRRRPSSSIELFTQEEERAVVRKFDRRLVLFVALLYMLSFLDRSNIGNARVAGMKADLQAATTPARSDWYELSLTAFYVTYIGFEWMSLLWRILPAHVYVSALVMSWGVVASLQAIVPSYPYLAVLRALLGVAEAGFTGIPFYLSFFFRRHELAFRTAIFLSAAPLATSFASALAWAIIKLGERGPIAPWRLLFLLEGFPSVFVSLIAWHVIPDSPQTASYLTARERRVARLRMRQEEDPGEADRRGGDGESEPKGSSSTAFKSRSRSRRSSESNHQSTGKGGRLRTAEMLAALVDPIALLTAAMFFLTNMAYSSLPVFLPTILEESMGHDRLRAQLLSAPPYLASFLIVLVSASASDRLRSRGVPIAFSALLSSLGYGLLALSDRPLGLDAASPLRYLAVYPAAIGFFSVVVLTLAWTVNNQPTKSRQGGGLALVQAVGQCGPLVGARLYPRAAAPFYTLGMAVCAVAMLAVAALAVLLRWLLVRRNRSLDRDNGGGGQCARPGDDEDEEEAFLSSSTPPSRGRRRRSGDDRRRRWGISLTTGFRYML